MLQYTFVNVHENGAIFSAKCALGGLLMSHYTFVNVHENEYILCPTLKWPLKNRFPKRYLEFVWAWHFKITYFCVVFRHLRRQRVFWFFDFRTLPTSHQTTDRHVQFSLSWNISAFGAIIVHYMYLINLLQCHWSCELYNADTKPPKTKGNHPILVLLFKFAPIISTSTVGLIVWPS